MCHIFGLSIILSIFFKMFQKIHVLILAIFLELSLFRTGFSCFCPYLSDVILIAIISDQITQPYSANFFKIDFGTIQKSSLLSNVMLKSTQQYSVMLRNTQQFKIFRQIGFKKSNSKKEFSCDNLISTFGLTGRRIYNRLSLVTHTLRKLPSSSQVSISKKRRLSW